MKSDQEIQNDVIAELHWEPALNTKEIGVSVRNGIITLAGYVNSHSEKLAAEKAAKRVKGVRAVAQNIEVTLAGGNLLPDRQIAETIKRKLEWSITIPDGKIQVMIDNGWIKLGDEVDSLSQKSGRRDNQ